MYANLKASLDKKGLSNNAAAKLIDMPEPTFRTKLNDRSFTVEEAFTIKEHLFPEMDFFYLFKRASESTNQ